eukprot:TRINITY_DN18481_c0_g1_i4.p3 TRINITY_DN18481_c0_g1~~TRINITY_DN18481_c0_g1_i4.p3  ORF type:complete len:111 (+),score=18.87 TRINITY_DN18481_c0_g1_i4:77-409(+)
MKRLSLDGPSRLWDSTTTSSCDTEDTQRNPVSPMTWPVASPGHTAVDATPREIANELASLLQSFVAAHEQQVQQLQNVLPKLVEGPTASGTRRHSRGRRAHRVSSSFTSS